MNDDPLNDPEAGKFLDRFRREALPHIKDSICTVALLDSTVDVKMMLEIGASVLLEKPIIVLHHRGGIEIPRRLRQLATAIIEFDSIDDPETKCQFMAAIEKAGKR